MVKHNLFFTSILREKTIQPRDQSANTEELDVIQVAPAIVLGLLGFMHAVTCLAAHRYLFVGSFSGNQPT